MAHQLEPEIAKVVEGASCFLALSEPFEQLKSTALHQPRVEYRCLWCGQLLERSQAGARDANVVLEILKKPDMEVSLLKGKVS